MKIDDLLHAIEFVAVGGPVANNAAYVRRQTGEIFFSGDDLDFAPLPDDIEDGSSYLAVPDKRQLDLGHVLAVRFASEHLPDDVERVHAFFRRRGAYSSFKELLSARDLLREWFAYEERATREAALRWCEDNKLKIDA